MVTKGPLQARLGELSERDCASTLIPLLRLQWQERELLSGGPWLKATSREPPRRAQLLRGF